MCPREQVTEIDRLARFRIDATEREAQLIKMFTSRSGASQIARTRFLLDYSNRVVDCVEWLHYEGIVQARL